MPAKHAHHAHFKLDNVQCILRYNVIMLQAASFTPIWAPRPHGSKHMLNQHDIMYLMTQAAIDLRNRRTFFTSSLYQAKSSSRHQVLDYTAT